MKLLSVGYIVLILILSTSCMMMHSMPMHNMGNRQSETVLTDPVCGLEVNAGSALTLGYEGIVYYFDSEDCLKVFKKNPLQFVKQHTQKYNRNGRGVSGFAILGGLAMATVMTIMIMGRVH